ncbi:MAG: efflux RND transporter periplasmic adaptor subunit [Pseudomonadota bacterium]
MTWRALLFVPALALGAALYWFQVQDDGAATVAAVEIAPVAVRVATIAPRPISLDVSGYGRVRARRTWEAVSQVDGRIVETIDDMSEGVMVPADAVLLRIDPRDYEIARDRALANLDTARSQLAELEAQAGNTAQQIDLERRIQDVSQAEVDRRTNLVDRGAASEATLEQAQRDLITQQRRVLDLENELALIPVQRVSAEATVRTREVELEEAERDLSNVTITAPFQARVAVADVEAGEYIRVGESLLTLNGLDAADIVAEVQPDAMRAALRVLLPDPGDLRPGVLTDPNAASRALEMAGISAEVRNTQNGQTDRWPAQIVRLDGSVDDSTGTLGIVVRVDNPAMPEVVGRRPPLATGAFVEVVFSGTTADAHAAVPREAVFEDASGSFVYVAAEGDVLARQAIEIGGRANGDLVVVDGLEAGDRIVLSAPQPTILGMALAPIESEALR